MPGELDDRRTRLGLVPGLERAEVLADGGQPLDGVGDSTGSSASISDTWLSRMLSAPGGPDGHGHESADRPCGSAPRRG